MAKKKVYKKKPKKKIIKKKCVKKQPAKKHSKTKIETNVLEKQLMFDKKEKNALVEGKTQKILGSDFFRIEPLNKIEEQPRQIEFELKDSEEVWAMGPNTRFKVRGVFQVMTPKVGEAPEVPWANATDKELNKVILQPNWFDFLIQTIEVFHGSAKINNSSNQRYLAPFVNAWKYNYMHPMQKKLLCPQPESPAYGVPSKVGEWSMDDAEKEWRKNYGPLVFSGKDITFDYIPLDLAPFFQGKNYLEQPQKILPMPLLDKITVRFLMNENLAAIFKKKADNPNLYRFVFTDMKFLVEKLRLSLSAKNTILNKKLFDYHGVTRIVKTEQITATDLIHKALIQKMLLPEGMFIFAVPKKVLQGTYAYGETTDNCVFPQHNIKSLEFKFGELNYFVNRPNLGMINDNAIESKLFFDYLYSAPFGLHMDPNKIIMSEILSGSKATPYPHVFVNFCNYGDNSRIVPYLNDGSILKLENNMEITFNFDTGGATADVTYLIYYYYTDNNLTLDTSEKKLSFFTSPYLKLV